MSNFLNWIKSWFLFPSLSVDLCRWLILLPTTCSRKGLGICYSHYLRIAGRLKQNSNFFSIKGILVPFALFFIQKVFLKSWPHFFVLLPLKFKAELNSCWTTLQQSVWVAASSDPRVQSFLPTVKGTCVRGSVMNSLRSKKVVLFSTPWKQSRKETSSWASKSKGSKWSDAEGFCSERSLPHLAFDWEESAAKHDVKKYLMKADLVK